ncbi:MAG: DUF3024 domain-containing protein [Candidatus Omnitrophota bacterium]
MGYSDKHSLIKKAAKINLDLESGYIEFIRLAKENGLAKERLEYYTNAYESAGDSGLRSLSYRKRMPEGIRKSALSKVNIYLSGRIPAHLKSEIGFLVKVKHNRITIAEKRPLFKESSTASCIEFCQMRYTDFDNRWHIYWKRKTGKWWPYIPQKTVYTIKDCLRELDEDICGCFWG